MKLCETCQHLTTDENDYCAFDGQRLVKDLIATPLQESLGAKYTLTELVGTGSMGAVYRAQHHQLDDVAIKVMLGPPSNQKLSQRFLREARALRKLRHPNSVLVYDLERSPTGLTYMVMEMIEGRSLRAVLEERGHLPLAETLEIAEAVCDALQAAHDRGIIHRDLKPDNILLAEEKKADGTFTRIIKIVDFGIVKLRGTEQGGEEASMQLTKYGAPIGTPFYMSPEQWFGDGPGLTKLDGRTDIYALGCTLYEMLAGQPPFIGETKEELRRKHLNDSPLPLNEMTPHVSESLSRVILRALEKDRDLRPSSAKEFATELRRACDEHEVETLKVKPQPRRAASESSTAVKDSDGEKKIAKMQTTEESMPLVRDWAAEEAQQAIEQMRGLQEAVATPELPAVHQLNEERATKRVPEKPPAAGVEKFDETTAPPAFPVKTESVSQSPAAAPAGEFQPTQILDRKPQRKSKSARKAVKESKDEGQELTLAQVGTLRIGVLADEMDGVENWRTPVPLPHAPKAVLGVVCVRGRMLTVLDPRALLDEKASGETNARNDFLITLRGDEQLALAVESVAGTIRVNVNEIAPLNPDSNTSAVRVITRDAQGEITVLNARELFDAAMHEAERRRQRT